MEFEKFKTMHFPRDVFVGHGVLENVALVVNQNLKSGPALILTGNTTYELAGKEVEEILKNNNIEVGSIKLGKADKENLARSLSIANEISAGRGCQVISFNETWTCIFMGSGQEATHR